ncbi:hypothetical protein [Rhizobium phage RHph_X2_30]|nr:hypothetical protein [Rhizobium phage RHph_X2_30]
MPMITALRTRLTRSNRSRVTHAPSSHDHSVTIRALDHSVTLCRHASITVLRNRLRSQRYGKAISSRSQCYGLQVDEMSCPGHSADQVDEMSCPGHSADQVDEMSCPGQLFTVGIFNNLLTSQRYALCCDLSNQRSRQMFKSRKTLSAMPVQARLAYYERIELMKCAAGLAAIPLMLAMAGAFDPGALGQIIRAAVTLAF